MSLGRDSFEPSQPGWCREDSVSVLRAVLGEHSAIKVAGVAKTLTGEGAEGQRLVLFREEKAKMDLIVVLRMCQTFLSKA